MEITRKEALALAKVLHYHPQSDRDSEHARTIRSLVVRIDEHLATPRDDEDESVLQQQTTGVGHISARELFTLPPAKLTSNGLEIRFWPSNRPEAVDLFVDGRLFSKNICHVIRHAGELWIATDDSDWQVLKVDFPVSWFVALQQAIQTTVVVPSDPQPKQVRAWLTQEQGKIDKLRKQNDSLRDVDELLKLSKAIEESDKLLSDDSYEAADYPRKGRGGNNRRHGRKR